jgi:hypothetical protein
LSSNPFFEKKKTTSFFRTTYVPWQTTTHAWAGIRGMLGSTGLEGHSRPETLNLTAWNHENIFLAVWLVNQLLRSKNMGVKEGGFIFSFDVCIFIS